MERGHVNWRGGMAWLIRAIYQPPLERERGFYRRLRELSEAMSEAPESIGLVVRGELYLERGEYERARRDFEAALKLAETVDSSRGWHIVEQVMRDRAIRGLREAERRL